jgi:hypothetical protein
MRTRKDGPDCQPDERNISVVICNTCIPYRKASHDGDRKIVEEIISTPPLETLGPVAPLLVATSYQGNGDKKHGL